MKLANQSSWHHVAPGVTTRLGQTRVVWQATGTLHCANSSVRISLNDILVSGTRVDKCIFEQFRYTYISKDTEHWKSLRPMCSMPQGTLLMPRFFCIMNMYIEDCENLWSLHVSHAISFTNSSIHLGLWFQCRIFCPCSWHKEGFWQSLSYLFILHKYTHLHTSQVHVHESRT